MIGLVNKVKEQVYTLLFFVRHNLQYIPAIGLASTTIAFISYIMRIWHYLNSDINPSEYEFSDTFLEIYTLADHYFSFSFVTLILFTAMSFYECWGKKAIYPLYYLWIMWLVVHYDISFMPDHDIIFYAFLSIIYITFVVLTVRALTNAKK